MGGTSSSSSCVIAVQIDAHGPVFGGGQLAGKVYLSVPTNGYSADTLNLKFYGREATAVVYHEHHNKRRTRKVAHGESPIVVLDLPLARFPNGQVEKGNYEFPFLFTLPYGLPGKQGSKTPNASYYVIEYFLEARLHRPGWLKWDVTNHQEVFLMDPPESSVATPTFNEPVTRPVYFMCCFNQGNMSLLTNVDNSRVGVGEPLKVDYSIYNASSARIKALEICLVESVRYTAHGKHHGETNELYKNRIEAGLLHGIEHNDEHNVKPNLMGDELFHEMNRHLSNVQFNIPACRSTFAGKLGTIRHTVAVRIITDIGSENPRLELALSVYQPSSAVFQGIMPEVGTDFARPVDWQAQAAPVMALHPTFAVATAVSASEPPLVRAVIVDVPGNNNNNRSSSSSSMAKSPDAPPAPPSAPDMTSVSSLVGMLQSHGNPFTEVSLLKEWLTYGDVPQLLNGSGALTSLFGAIRGEYALAAFPEEIGKALPGQVRTSHVVEAAKAVVNVESRAKLCSAFATYVSDKENARSAFTALKLPEHMLTLVLIQYGQ